MTNLIRKRFIENLTPVSDLSPPQLNLPRPLCLCHNNCPIVRFILAEFDPLKLSATMNANLKMMHIFQKFHTKTSAHVCTIYSISLKYS